MTSRVFIYKSVYESKNNLYKSIESTQKLAERVYETLYNRCCHSPIDYEDWIREELLFGC